MIYTPIKAVFFDNNGTLEDDLPVALGSKNETFRFYGLDPPSDDQYRQEVSSDYMPFYYKYKIPANITEADLNSIRNRYYLAHKNERMFRPDAKDTVNRCNELGLKTAIVSAETEALHERLKEAGFFDCFDVVRTRAWPKKGALSETLEKMKLLPSRVLYIDDTVEGLESARSVGMIPVGFTNPTAYNSEDRVRRASRVSINNLADLIPRLKDVNGSVWFRID